MYDLQILNVRYGMYQLASCFAKQKNLREAVLGIGFVLKPYPHTPIGVFV